MLIIFDCDGVLVDSESLAAQVFATLLHTYGITLNASECEKRFRGHTLQYCLKTLKQDYPGKLPGDFLDVLSKATRETFGEQLLPVPGIEAVLQWLGREKCAFCVASNGALAKVHHSLEVTGLRHYFGNNCFSAESVQASKPAPDLFLHAAQTMGFGPHQTLVVEDSQAGITAAMRAGMRVCVFGSEAVAAGGTHDCCDDMAKLPQILGKWLGY